MFFDSLEQAKMYYQDQWKLKRAFTAIEEYAAKPFQTGSWDIDGEDLYLIATEYTTVPLTADCQMEAHRKYIDVMYLIEGQECIYCKPTELLSNIVSEYCTEEDCLLAEVDTDREPHNLYQSQVAVLFPHDAHCPCCCIDEERLVKKLICKVRCDNA